VRVLLDECIDWRLARDLGSHDVKTTQQMGWTGIKNGESLMANANAPGSSPGSSTAAAMPLCAEDGPAPAVLIAELPRLVQVATLRSFVAQGSLQMREHLFQRHRLTLEILHAPHRGSRPVGQFAIGFEHPETLDILPELCRLSLGESHLRA
jgi:hypothetical protein